MAFHGHPAKSARDCSPLSRLNLAHKRGLQVSSLFISSLAEKKQTDGEKQRKIEKQKQRKTKQKNREREIQK